MFSELARKELYDNREENLCFELRYVTKACTVIFTCFCLTSHKAFVVIGANIANIFCLSLWFNKRSFNTKDSRKKKMPEKKMKQ